MNCIFSEPVDLGSGDYEYSEIDCEVGDIYELMENATTGAEFYLEKTFSYGDFFVVFCLMIFVLFEIVKIIWKGFVKKR